MRTDPPSCDAPPGEPSLRTAEVARALGVSPRAIRTWADEGKIACYRTFGGHRLFTASEVRRVLASWRGGLTRCTLRAKRRSAGWLSEDAAEKPHTHAPTTRRPECPPHHNPTPPSPPPP